MEESQIWFSLVILALVLVSAVADNVVDLTEENFDKEVGQDHQGALVEFYAPWCGHCNSFAPEYEKLGTSFKDAKSVLIGKVNCVEQKSLCSRYELPGYPTIRWFPKGSLDPKKFEGRRTVEALAKFIDTERNDVLVIATEKKFDNEIPQDLSTDPNDVVPTEKNSDKEVEPDLSAGPNDVAVPIEENFDKEVQPDLSTGPNDVAVPTEKNSDKEVEPDLSAGPNDVNVPTKEIFDKEVEQDLSVVPDNAIVLTEENFNKEVTQDLSDALEDVIVLTEENFDKQVGHDRGAMVVFYATWCEHYITLVPEYGKLGTSFKNANSVLIGKVDCNYHKFLCWKYVVRGYPTIQWFPKGSLHPKKYDGRRTVEALVEFVNIEKDALIPIEKNKKMPLKIVDATISDFDQALEKLVSVPNQLSLILFLGDKDPSTSLSWCPDSVRAEPVIYKKLEESSGEVALLRAYVGDRPTWRNPNHPWRVDSRFNLKSIPTLVRWENGAVNGQLEDHEAHIESKIDALISRN